MMVLRLTGNCIETLTFRKGQLLYRALPIHNFPWKLKKYMGGMYIQLEFFPTTICVTRINNVIDCDDDKSLEYDSHQSDLVLLVDLGEISSFVTFAGKPSTCLEKNFSFHFVNGKKKKKQ